MHCSYGYRRRKRQKVGEWHSCNVTIRPGLEKEEWKHGTGVVRAEQSGGGEYGCPELRQ
jgi:hypothetical protein